MNIVGVADLCSMMYVKTVEFNECAFNENPGIPQSPLCYRLLVACKSRISPFCVVVEQKC